ncbi:hypothetical protein DCC39_18360 [Pueribacillus theae]|uniref:Uncharacterized protein n=1 Tax=Pueribacillus theae TaxID=2171751 RepID=A0A2U1JJS4_9BACI|nr:hypothetical protein DCC39_18360 [Pueribacillus theae]
MLTFEYTEIYDYPASIVFSRLIDLEGRPSWIKGIMEARVTPKRTGSVGDQIFRKWKILRLQE